MIYICRLIHNLEFVCTAHSDLHTIEPT